MNWFGNVAIVLFIAVQTIDLIFTYVGVRVWGLDIEANPIVSSFMRLFGGFLGILIAKLAAILFGVILHIRRRHRLVILLTFFYIVIAIVPWVAIFLTQ